MKPHRVLPPLSGLIKPWSLYKIGKFTDPEKAIEYLNEAIRLKPGYAWAYVNRGQHGY